MNKRYLPAIAAIFIIALTASSFIPVYAATALRAQVSPTLFVLTIPEDDEVHKTGIMLLGSPPSGQPFWRAKTDLLAQFKVIVSLNGVPVRATLTCQVIEKDKVNPLKTKQGVWENLVSVPKDATGNFVCKYREGKPGIGVIDVYWVGPSATSPVINVGQFIADYILIVQFTYTVGRTVIYGTEMQDICVLGWPLVTTGFDVVTKPDGTEHYVFPNPLGDFVSCEDAALYQKDLLGLTIPWS
jgi:hypothetical protein